MRSGLFSFVVVFGAVTVLMGCSSSDDGGSSAAAGAAVGGSGGSPAVGGAGGLIAAGSGGFAGLSTANVAGFAGAVSGVAGGQGTAGVGGTGGSSTGVAGAASGIPATFATVKLVVDGGGSVQSCGSAPCHGNGGVAPPNKPLTLVDDAQLYLHLTTYTSVACGNIPLVKPGSPSESALIKILTGPCGATPRMPYACDPSTGGCIPDEYIAAVAQWISNGALNQ